jgi:hypothetical protein
MKTETEAQILLQLKGFPSRIKALIQREADNNRRSLTQEAIVLLEEGLLARASSQKLKRDQIDEILDRYHQLPTLNKRPLDEIIEYDELGLPR